MLLINTAKELLDQLDGVIHQISNDSYTSSIETLSGASVGQHVRHTLEFFICLIDAANHNQLNYDLRKHDRVLETDKKIASSIIKSIKEFLTNNLKDKPIKLEANYAIDDDENIIVNSSLYRELVYNIEHAIHHMALIKIGVKITTPEIVLPPHFGVASSTVRYHKQD